MARESNRHQRPVGLIVGLEEFVTFWRACTYEDSARTASPRPAANNRRRSTGSLPLEHHGARSSPAALEGPLGQVSTEDLEEAEGFAGLGEHGVTMSVRLLLLR